MSFSHTTTASLSNRHCIGRVQSIHSSKCLGLFQQEVAAHLMLKDFIKKATWTYFTIKKPSFWKWAETVGGTKPPTPEMFCCDRNWQRLKRWFIMWNPHTHTHKKVHFRSSWSKQEVFICGFLSASLSHLFCRRSCANCCDLWNRSVKRKFRGQHKGLKRAQNYDDALLKHPGRSKWEQLYPLGLLKPQ